MHTRARQPRQWGRGQGEAEAVFWGRGKPMSYRASWHEADTSKFSASRRGICLEDCITGTRYPFKGHVQGHLCGPPVNTGDGVGLPSPTTHPHKKQSLPQPVSQPVLSNAVVNFHRSLQWPCRAVDHLCLCLSPPCVSKATFERTDRLIFWHGGSNWSYLHCLSKTCRLWLLL